MALITTVGGATSDSYVTTAEFVAYANALGWAIGTGPDSDHETHCRRAAQYLDRHYKFIGTKVAKAQALAWPRHTGLLDADGFAINSDEIPEGVRRAQFEISWLVHQGKDILATITTGTIKSSRVKAGSVESSAEYSGGIDRPKYPQVDGLLSGLIVGNSATIKVGRG